MLPKLLPNIETENQLVADALKYAQFGFLVFPVHTVKDGKCTCGKDDCSSPAKHPRTVRGLKQASKDLNFVKNLFGNFNYRSANIAIRTGKESNLVVVDVDSTKGGRIEDLYNFVPKEILEKTLWIKTGGGFHLYFAFPQTVEIRNSTSKLGNKIDIRGEGNYVVAPPSMHISGKHYEFFNNNDILPFPQAFIEKLNKPEAQAEKNLSNGKPLQADLYSEGTRNDSLTSVAGKLRHAGLSESELEPALLKINSERCKPPLNEKEVLQIACSISRYDIQTQPQTKFNSETNAEDFKSAFIVKSGNAWIESAKVKPIPKPLFDEFWAEGEICIFFGDTGKGKSVLSIQIADSIAKGVSIGNFALKAEPQTVLVFDLELSEKQFEKRYSIEGADCYTNHYVWSENFRRGAINPYAVTPKRFKNFEEYFFFSLEWEIVQTETRILVVDNITYLKTQLQDAKEAIPLMQKLIISR